MASSDWCAKEKECKDSLGNRFRSSPKFKPGDVVPGVKVAVIDGRREEGRERFKEEDRGGSCRPWTPWLEGFLDGCCRMRRKPDAPRPCSCSGMIGDLHRTVDISPGPKYMRNFCQN